ncbi:hypothetical protein HPB47_004848 [Ixodes persulcatus]|uniref:Uncharacterized protein n=1 Tax=Ixodes persulcatus TaxID=34615 RepID=A0AC60PEQ9_IXOPE|nr:hypothetical protein HPB47_004848 [Ixodes persulcatus]
MADNQDTLQELAGICGEQGDTLGMSFNGDKSGVIVFNDEKQEPLRIQDIVIDHVGKCKYLLNTQAYADAQAKKQRTLKSAVAVFKQHQQDKKALAPSGSYQKAFNRYLAEMIAIDDLPSSFTKELGVKRLMEYLKPEQLTLIVKMKQALKTAQPRSLIFLKNSARATALDVIDAGKQVVKEHNDTSRVSGAIDAVPLIFAQSRLAELQDPLKPLGDATDRLQGNGITSAILRLCISTCYIYPTEE